MSVVCPRPVPSQDFCKSLRFPSSDFHPLESWPSPSSPAHCLSHLFPLSSPGWSFPDSVPLGTRHLNSSVLSSEGFSRGKVEGTSGTSPSGGADIPWPPSYFTKAGVPGGFSWVVKQSKAPASPDLHGRPSRLCTINLMADVLCMIWFFPQARAIYLNHLSWHKVRKNMESWVAFPNHCLLTVFPGATSSKLDWEFWEDPVPRAHHPLLPIGLQ